MKILVSSDWHGDWVTHGIRRFAEVQAAVRETIEVAKQERCAAYVFAGDLCDPDSGSSVFRVVELAIATAVELARENISSIWVAGNHDTIEDGTRDTSLSPLRALARDHRGLVGVFEEPGAFNVRVRIDMDDYRTVRIVALPFTAAQHPYDVEQAAKKIACGAEPRDVVFVSHLTVPGVVPGEETTEMPRGREVVLPVDAIRPLGAHLINGHYHRQQRTESGVWIPGSLARLTFCEERHRPGYLVVEV